MRFARFLVCGVVVASLVAAFVVDRGDRPTGDGSSAPNEANLSVPLATQGTGVWFCPGGSAPGGDAEVGIELINVGSDVATAVVAGVRSGTGVEPRETTELLDPGERRLVRVADLVPDSAWMGAVIEVESGLVVVEQTFIGMGTGSDRAPCHTRTATKWIVASGATRVDELGEEMTLLVLNPFLDDAVLDVSFDSDVGVDSLVGVVVPARRVLTIDVTEAVTVASRVSAVVDVVAGQVAVSRMQVEVNDEQTGLSVTPASADAAPVWFLPTVHRSERDDIITVVNPSATEVAEVDLEIVADGDLTFDPVELTIGPRRSVAVALADEQRLAGAGAISVVARSLTGLPIAVMNESFLTFDEGRVSNMSATPGSDAAATRWVAPLDTDAGGVVLWNPSPLNIATASVSVITGAGEELVANIEIDPASRSVIDSDELPGTRPLVVVDASSPVVVGRELADVSLHAQLIAIAVGPDVVPLG